MKKFGRKRYTVQAKRRDSNEKWSDWTDTNSYQRAVHHACCVEEAGYLAKIVVREKQVEELWGILGKNEHEKADAILDAGFRKQSEVTREIFEEIEMYMMDFVDVSHTAYKTIDIDTFAKLKKKYTED